MKRQCPDARPRSHMGEAHRHHVHGKLRPMTDDRSPWWVQMLMGAGIALVTVGSITAVVFIVRGGL